MSADKVMLTIIDAYFSPNRSLRELCDLIKAGASIRDQQSQCDLEHTRMGAPEYREQAVICSQVAASSGTTDARDMRGFQAGHQSISYNSLADIHWQETFYNRVCVVHGAELLHDYPRVFPEPSS